MYMRAQSGRYTFTVNLRHESKVSHRLNIRSFQFSLHKTHYAEPRMSSSSDQNKTIIEQTKNIQIYRLNKKRGASIKQKHSSGK
jgi:hypothetical protein